MMRERRHDVRGLRMMEKWQQDDTKSTSRGAMRIGIILGIVLVIILGVTLWKRGKPPVP